MESLIIHAAPSAGHRGSGSRSNGHARGAASLDFGWRLRGKPIRVLPDFSLRLSHTFPSAAAASLSGYCDAESLVSCLQCGTCTATCNLSEAADLFPRRQMALLQCGQLQKLLADPDIWFCSNCADCSSGCPAHARPGQVMAGLRLLAIERHSVPRWWSRMANRRTGSLLMPLLAAVVLLVAVAAGGSFFPQASPVLYASLLPHFALNLVFGFFSVLLLVATGLGAARAWSEFTGERLWEADWSRLRRALASVAREVFTQKSFRECQQFPLSRLAHLAVFYGSVLLAALAGVVAVLMRLGVPYPFPLLHPLKIVGNAAGVLVIAGTLYFIHQRHGARRKGEPSAWQDWALLWQILLVSVTGMLAEAFRYACVPWLAYPVYFAHLVLVFVLMGGLACSKLAHVVYRTVALTAREYGTVIPIPRPVSQIDLQLRRTAA
jgi:quinone-modifying oxidoreductase subunit QmoC